MLYLRNHWYGPPPLEKPLATTINWVSAARPLAFPKKGQKQSRVLSFYRPGQPNWENMMCIFQDFLPLRFYVETIFGILKPQKLSFSINWGGLNFALFGILGHFQALNSQRSKSQGHKIVKMQLVTFWNQWKLISRKIRVADKLLNFHIVVVVNTLISRNFFSFPYI